MSLEDASKIVADGPPPFPKLVLPGDPGWKIKGDFESKTVEAEVNKTYARVTFKAYVSAIWSGGKVRPTAGFEVGGKF